MANRDLSPWTRGAALSPFGGRDPFTSFRREMDRLFDDFFTPAESRSFTPTEASGANGVWPSLDLHETDKAYVITAELPGIDRKDVEVNLSDNLLTIRGEKRSERKEEDGGRRYSERSFGRFERTIPLSGEVDPERVEAGFDNGVLTITLPKNAQARDKSRRIEIKPRAQGGGNDITASPPKEGGGAGSRGTRRETAGDPWGKPGRPREGR